MFRVPSYLAREALVSLRRNALVVAGAVLAVFVSMLLAFGALLVNELVRVNTLQWQEGVHVIVFLKDIRDGVTEGAQLDLLQEINTWDMVDTTYIVDKAGAYDEFRRMFADQPALLEEMDPSVLPASIRIELSEIDRYREVQYRLAGQPQVLSVRSLGEWIEQLSSLRRVLNGLGLGMALVLGFSAVVLIANTIRMAIYARRDEVAIMKLVGASNWFIRVPFLLEGLIEGVVGAGLAVLTVWLTARNLSDADTSIELVRFAVSSGFFLRWGLAFLLFGALAGVLGSVVGLRRFLKV